MALPARSKLKLDPLVATFGDIGRKLAVLPRSKPISSTIGSQRADVFVNVFGNKFPKVPHRLLARRSNFSANNPSQ